MGLAQNSMTHCNTVLLFFPFLFRVVLSLSRSNLIILGDASDEE